MRQRGLTLVELLMGMAVAGLLMAGLYAAVHQALVSWQDHSERSEVQRQLAFALERMALHARGSSLLLLPQPERTSTAWSESVRDVLAFTLDRDLDRDGDGFVDADNDKDGRVDEDANDDTSNDGAAGIVGIDDNGDGTADAVGLQGDDDEDGAQDEDGADGRDDDADGLVDEDGAGATDDDGDGAQGEDWIDAVVYRLSGTDLLERLPDPGGADGRAYTERTIVRNVTRFEARRVGTVTGARMPVVELTLEITGPQGYRASAGTRLRVGETR